MGTPKVRQHSCILLLRRQGPHMARTILYVAEDLRRCPTHRIREPRRMGTARSGLPPRLRLLRWQCLSTRV